MAGKTLRRALEFGFAGLFLVALFVWPHSRLGWIVQIVSAVLALVFLGLLRKWPST
jgi:VIT1/CCC1 family predicted Fe2+/Mn2+ transporter